MGESVRKILFSYLEGCDRRGFGQADELRMILFTLQLLAETNPNSTFDTDLLSFRMVIDDYEKSPCGAFPDLQWRVRILIEDFDRWTCLPQDSTKEERLLNGRCRAAEVIIEEIRRLQERRRAA